MTHDEELDLGWRAPTWAQKLADGIRRLLARQQTDRELLLTLSERTGRILQQQEKIMATQDEVLELARQAKTVSESSNIAVKEALRLLKAGQADPAKNEEAASLLRAIIADDSAVLTENTAAEEESPPA